MSGPKRGSIAMRSGTILTSRQGRGQIRATVSNAKNRPLSVAEQRALQPPPLFNSRKRGLI